MFKRYTIDEVIIKELSETHKNILPNFCSFQEDLKEYLIDNALMHQLGLLSRTFLWFEKDSNKLMGYITICNDSIRLSNIKRSLQKKLRYKGVPYSSLPALKIARICADDNFRRRGLGTLMMQFCLKISLEITKKSGCRFITLDSKHHKESDKDPRLFYKEKWGFIEMKISEEEKAKRENTTPMYLDLINFVRD
ncbi:MAG TPA: GNAT family N-acetyltransferase [Candidatus Nanoarchaeia archaeon]|nr:GNAT family N-acetyltransferase [Candidatus Nanoarchaeia archaeon]